MPFGRLNRTALRRLGEEITITPEGGAAYACRGIYELERNEGSSPGTGGRPDPRVTISADETVALERGAVVALRGRTFALVRPEPDDGGMVTLHLREQH